MHAMHTLTVHMLIFTFQQYVQASVTEARLLAGQYNQTLTQAVVVSLWLVAIARNRNQQQTAGTTLGEGELLADMLDGDLHRVELQPFFFDHRLQRFLVQAQICDQLAQSRVLVP